MTGTMEGLSVPIYGEFYRYSADQTQNLYVEDDGVWNLTVSNTTDTHDNIFAITYTTSGTYASGYGNVCYVAMNVGGTSSGGASTHQFNAFGTDITINGTHTAGIGGMYVYIAEGTATLTSAQVYGGWFDIMEIGQTDYLSCLRLSMQTTTIATAIHSFIHCALDGSGTATSLIAMQGSGRPTYFLSHSIQTAGGYYDATAGASDDTPVGRLAVNLAGTAAYIYLFAGS